MQDHLADRPDVAKKGVPQAIETFLEGTPHGVELHNLAFSLHERLVLPYEPATPDPFGARPPGGLQVCILSYVSSLQRWHLQPIYRQSLGWQGLYHSGCSTGVWASV